MVIVDGIAVGHVAAAMRIEAQHRVGVNAVGLTQQRPVITVDAVE